MRLQYILPTIIAASATTVTAAPAKLDLKSYLSGNTLNADTSPSRTIIRLRKNGSYLMTFGVNARDGLEGRWYIKGQSVCLNSQDAQLADIPDNCYPIEVKPFGTEWTGRPTLGGYIEKSAWRFHLKAGDR